MPKIQRGFMLAECAVLLAALAAAYSLIAVSLAGSRAAASRQICESHLKQVGMASVSYSIDYQDRLPTYSWSKDRFGSQFKDLNDAAGAATHDAARAALQAAEILRFRTGNEAWTAPANWLPHSRYFSLVIWSYLGGHESSLIFVCPDDAPTLAIRSKGTDRDPDAGPGPQSIARFRSSYEMPPSMFDAFQSQFGGRLPDETMRLRQGATEREFVLTDKSRLLGVRVSDLAFPTAKVLAFEARDAHQGDAWRLFADPEARPGLALADGSVRAIAARDINIGWDPASEAGDAGAVLLDDPASGDRPETAAPLQSPRHWGRMRWTRGGLRGIDLGGREVQTGNRGPAPTDANPTGEPRTPQAGDISLSR